MTMTTPATEFKPLTLSTLSASTGFSRAYYLSPNPVEISSYALEVMTDLRFVPAATTLANVSLANASQKMIARGVRLLLVIDSIDDVIGLITARDLDGARVQESVKTTGLSTEALLVQHVMTTDVEVMPLDAVLLSRVGDIVETLKHSGRQHALVVDTEPFTNKPMVRGVFSASQIAKQLGFHSGQTDLSRTFEQIDQAITARKAR
jgi:hypothetical protein